MPVPALWGLLILLGDLGVIAGLVVAVVVAARRLLPSQLARSGASARRRWAVLIVAVTALGLVVLGNTEMLIYSYQQGRPSLAQVAGTWTDSGAGGGATLRIFPDGRFTATGLPPDTSSSGTRDVTVRALPADEHGTWQMTRQDGVWYVLCSLSGGPQFQVYIVGPGSPGGPLEAELTYVQGEFDSPITDFFDKQARGL
jgi:hypothetical protein